MTDAKSQQLNCTAVILARNEQDSIVRALESVRFCKQVIVYDDNSSDKTATLARQKGAEVREYSVGKDFSAARNHALEHAKHDWVLFIDADEVLSSALASEIWRIYSYDDNPYEVYYLRRRDFFWGSELMFGETMSVRSRGLPRLLRRGSGVWQGSVHEDFVTTAPTARLEGFIDHYAHKDLSQFITDINTYSSMRASEIVTSRPPAPFLTFELLVFPPLKFAWTYIVKLGFMDGAPGFVYSFMMSFHSFLARAKAYQQLYLNKKSS